MANEFLRAERIIAQGLGLLRRDLILPRMVTRLGIADFRGAKDDTINIRVPAILQAREYEWRTRTNPIVVDEITEESIPVQLNKHPYNAIAITDEELTLDITDWGAQVASPQIIAVAEKLESYVAAAMQNANYAATPIDFLESADPASQASPFYNALVDARKVLNDNHVPTAGRVVALGSAVEAAALKEPGFRRVDQSGSTDALREAIIGRTAGFTVIGNVQSLPENFAVAFHPSAFAFANVAPEVPAGAAAGATLVFDGLAMRWIRDYDAPYLRDRSVYSAFAGAASVEDGRDDHGQLNGSNIRAVTFNFVPAGS